MGLIQTAVIGFGLSARVFHAPFIEHSSDFSMSAILKRTGESAKEAYPDAAIYRDLDSLLADDAIELVVITTPNQHHYAMTAKVLAAGKHVVVEKPFVASLSEAKTLFELAKRQQLHLFVYHNRRFDGDFVTLARLIRGGELGRVVRYEAQFDRFRPELNTKQWKERPEPSVSIVHDLGTHLLDQAVALFGRPLSVTADLRAERDGSRVIDAFDIFLEYSSRVAHLKASCLIKEPGPRYAVHGTEGSFVKYGIDPQEERLLDGDSPANPDLGLEEEQFWGILNTRKPEEKRLRVKTERGNYLAYYRNVASVFQGGEMAVSHQDVLTTIEIIEAAFTSDREKRSVSL